MDENKHEADKIDDLMLPGFRFHPTDEELVAFYLRRKIQHQPLPIELIKQVDIYKFDPWDLPKLAATGEKECYFYCPRDRKYRNSTRPNRVTGAGFWKATGTDRPIYSSNGAKCVGLKKSLVFYRGRAAKGMKTDWMMHEFRLPSLSDSIPAKKLLDKGIPANDSWVICRIFKKTSSMAQRALACSWLAPVHEPPELFNQSTASSAQFSQDNTSCTTEVGSAGFDFPFYKLINPPKDHHTNTPIFPTLDMSPSIPKSPYSSLLLNLSPAFPSDMAKTDETLHFEPPNQHLNSFPFSSLLDVSSGGGANPVGASIRSSLPFPFAFPAPSWDSPSELSTGYSSNKCYT